MDFSFLCWKKKNTLSNFYSLWQKNEVIRAFRGIMWTYGTRVARNANEDLCGFVVFIYRQCISSAFIKVQGIWSYLKIKFNFLDEMYFGREHLKKKGTLENSSSCSAFSTLLDKKCQSRLILMLPFSFFSGACSCSHLVSWGLETYNHGSPFSWQMSFYLSLYV